MKLTMQETIDTTPDEEGVLIIPDLNVELVLPDNTIQNGRARLVLDCVTRKTVVEFFPNG